MTDEEAITRFVEALLGPLRDVGTMLAKALDETNARVTTLERRLDSAQVGQADD